MFLVFYGRLVLECGVVFGYKECLGDIVIVCGVSRVLVGERW